MGLLKDPQAMLKKLKNQIALLKRKEKIARNQLHLALLKAKKLAPAKKKSKKQLDSKKRKVKKSIN